MNEIVFPIIFVLIFLPIFTYIVAKVLWWLYPEEEKECICSELDWSKYHATKQEKDMPLCPGCQQRFNHIVRKLEVT